MAKRKYVEIEYTHQIATNLNDLAGALGIPRKIINEWRKSWLSYPVTEEDFKSLVIIKNHVWGKESVLRAQMAHKNKGDMARFVRNSTLSRPVAFARDELLRHKLLGSRYYLTTKKLKETVRGYFPNGYVSVTSDVVKKLRRWVHDQVRTADQEKLELLQKSVGLIKNEEGRLIRKKRKTPKKEKVLDDFMYI